MSCLFNGHMSPSVAGVWRHKNQAEDWIYLGGDWTPQHPSSKNGSQWHSKACVVSMSLHPIHLIILSQTAIGFSWLGHPPCMMIPAPLISLSDMFPFFISPSRSYGTRCPVCYQRCAQSCMMYVAAHVQHHYLPIFALRATSPYTFCPRHYLKAGLQTQFIP